MTSDTRRSDGLSDSTGGAGLKPLVGLCRMVLELFGLLSSDSFSKSPGALLTYEGISVPDCIESWFISDSMWVSIDSVIFDVSLKVPWDIWEVKTGLGFSFSSPENDLSLSERGTLGLSSRKSPE